MDREKRLDGLTVGQMLKQVGASDAFLKVLEAHGGTFTTASPALGALPDLAYHFGDENLFRISGGNQRLPEAMAAALGEKHLVLDAPVTAIHQSADGISVTVKDGRAFRGDHAISTIPFSVLGEVAVTPAWSPAKMWMFDQFDWSNTVKVVVQTKAPIWLAKGVHGWPMAGSDRPWERVIDITGNEQGGYGNLFFYLNDRNAERYLSQPKDVRGEQLVKMFQSDLPGLIEDVVTIKEVAWSEQPWIKRSFGGPPLTERLLDDRRVDATRGQNPLRRRLHNDEDRLGRGRHRIRLEGGPTDRSGSPSGDRHEPQARAAASLKRGRERLTVRKLAIRSDGPPPVCSIPRDDEGCATGADSAASSSSVS